ncbi:MAG: hypothetical protein ABJK39_13370 [Hyphomicrobiales bacterium]
MPNGSLTTNEAREVWIMYAENKKIRDIQKSFDIDPRRIYEVLEEKKHIGTRQDAKAIFAKKFPNRSTKDKFVRHIPRNHVKKRDEDDQGSLF